jgi:superfamily I DNA/RNA helicase/mRNA-degrading endonuclease RelE of RelBE toxin-antitoxin system
VKREINIKPSFMSELHGFPQNKNAQLWEKIDYLVEDPIPDGKLKIKLKNREDLYRLRVGDYRIFYTYGDTWVRLLALRKRNERTYSDKSENIEADQPSKTELPSFSDLDAALSESSTSQEDFSFKEGEKKTPLARKLTEKFLHSLKIDPTYFPHLVGCKSEEDLLSAKIPQNVLERIVDNLYPASLEEIERQPDFVVRQTDDLVRYKEGHLFHFLLKLDEAQKRLVNWAIKGPTMIKGGAGTGKSTIALYRVKALLEREGRTGEETVLFTTYTRALVNASRQLLEQILTEEQMKRVEIATVDQVVMDIVSSRRRLGKTEQEGSAVSGILRRVLQEFEPQGKTAFERKLRKRKLGEISERYLREEFDWVIDGRAIVSLEEYQKAPRPGRGLVLREEMRGVLWEVYQAFRKEVDRENIERFSELRKEALSLVQMGSWQKRFDYVVVDEAQDLAPTALALMAELARSAEGLFFASDSKQSLYSKNYTWSSTHPRLQFKGRTAILKRNYRSTHELDRAAFDILRAEDGEVLESSESLHHGPLPVFLRYEKREDIARWIVRFLQQMAKHLRLKVDASAVLVPSKEIGQWIAEALEKEGVAASFFTGRKFDLSADAIKILTMHSAKGLEFPMIVVCGFEDGTYPKREEFGDEAVYEERLREARRLLYVSMTRAMRGLMLMVPRECSYQALEELNRTHWHLEEVE